MRIAIVWSVVWSVVWSDGCSQLRHAVRRCVCSARILAKRNFLQITRKHAITHATHARTHTHKHTQARAHTHACTLPNASLCTLPNASLGHAAGGGGNAPRALQHALPSTRSPACALQHVTSSMRPPARDLHHVNCRPPSRRQLIYSPLHSPQLISEPPARVTSPARTRSSRHPAS